MLTEDGVSAWLSAQGVETVWYWDGTPWTEIQDPTAVVLDLSGGSAPQFERAFDTPTIQVLTRGDQNDHAGARELAWQIDSALMTAVPPLTLGTPPVRVISITRVGGPPRLLSRDAARRFIFTANYLFLAARQ